MKSNVKETNNFCQQLDIYICISCFTGNNPKTLNEECQKLLTKFVEIIQEFMQKLMLGDILIETVKKLSNNSGSFRKVLVSMKTENEEFIMRTLELRTRELEAFESTYQIVQEFTYVCIHCKGMFLNFIFLSESFGASILRFLLS